MENVLENTAMRYSINLITPVHCKIKSHTVKLKQGRKNCNVKGFPEFLKPTAKLANHLKKTVGLFIQFILP